MTECPLGDAGALCHRAAHTQGPREEMGSELAEPRGPGHCLANKVNQQKSDREHELRPCADLPLTKEEHGCCFTATFQISSKLSLAALANPELCREGNSGKQGSSLAELTR